VEKMIERIGGRKVAMAIAIVAIGLVVAAINGDIPDNLLALLQVVFGAFVLGNGFEHAAGAYTSGKGAPNAELASSVEELKAHAATTQEALATTQEGIGAILKIASGYRGP
jgi:hypothetical protein